VQEGREKSIAEVTARLKAYLPAAHTRPDGSAAQSPGAGATP